MIGRLGSEKVITNYLQSFTLQFGQFTEKPACIWKALERGERPGIGGMLACMGTTNLRAVDVRPRATEVAERAPDLVGPLGSPEACTTGTAGLWRNAGIQKCLQIWSMLLEARLRDRQKARLKLLQIQNGWPRRNLAPARIPESAGWCDGDGEVLEGGGWFQTPEGVKPWNSKPGTNSMLSNKPMAFLWSSSESLDRSKEAGIACVNECTLQVCLVSDHRWSYSSVAILLRSFL